MRIVLDEEIHLPYYDPEEYEVPDLKLLDEVNIRYSIKDNTVIIPWQRIDLPEEVMNDTFLTVLHEYYLGHINLYMYNVGRYSLELKPRGGEITC